MLEVVRRTIGGVHVLDASGPLIENEVAPLKTAILSLFNEPGTNGTRHKIISAVQVLLNLEKVTEMDSDGLGVLVSLFSAVFGREGQFKLLNPNEQVMGMLRASSLDTVFEIYRDERRALASFAR